VLRDVNFRIEDGDFVAIIGPSGSGKTTLLGLLAGLDVPSSRQRAPRRHGICRASPRTSAPGCAATRSASSSSRFQLIPSLTAQENVQVPMELRGDAGAPERAAELLERASVSEKRRHHYPTQLSGGEQQRVALARAVVHGPRILVRGRAHRQPRCRQRIRDHGDDRGTEPRPERITLVLVTHDLRGRLPRPARDPPRRRRGGASIRSRRRRRDARRTVRGRGSLAAAALRWRGARAASRGGASSSSSPPSRWGSGRWSRCRGFPPTSRPACGTRRGRCSARTSAVQPAAASGQAAALVDSLRAQGAGVARATGFVSMARAPRTGGVRLVQVRAVEPGFPFYGTIQTQPVGAWDRLDGGATCWSIRRC
jgi:putative ABC transport system ATP-binding protein